MAITNCEISVKLFTLGIDYAVWVYTEIAEFFSINPRIMLYIVIMINESD